MGEMFTHAWEALEAAGYSRDDHASITDAISAALQRLADTEAERDRWRERVTSIIASDWETAPWYANWLRAIQVTAPPWAYERLVTAMDRLVTDRNHAEQRLADTTTALERVCAVRQGVSGYFRVPADVMGRARDALAAVAPARGLRPQEAPDGAAPPTGPKP